MAMATSAIIATTVVGRLPRNWVRRFATTAANRRYSPRVRRLLVLLGLFCFSACSKGSAKPQGKQAPKDAHVTADADPAKLEGKVLYETFCAQCHGADAKGYKSDNAPSLVNPTFLESATDEYIATSIKMGRPGTSMAGYGKDIGGPLDQATITRLVGYLRSQGPEAKSLGTAGSTGDPARGAPIYARECQKCHGDQATRMTAVHLANAQFLSVATDPFLRYAIANGRPGTPMESFAGKLKADEIDDVVAYIRGFATQTQIATLPAPTGKEPLVINPKGKDPVWKNLRQDPDTKTPRFVSVDEVNKAMSEGKKMVIIDARPQSDWMRVHIKGAVSIPYHDMKRLDEMPKDTWAIAYCACPHHLSGIVVDELIKRGYKKALVLDEGILEWHRRGYPVVAAPGVTAPPKEQHP
jgi:mono/diheme cytochrome c family protein/rhodanese-related sulfurtransferase